METITALLSPEQVEVILAVYGTVAEWYSQAIDLFTVQNSSIVIEDMYV